jgi:hypothetical protein
MGHLPAHRITVSWFLRWDDPSLPAPAAGSMGVHDVDGQHVIVVDLRSTLSPWELGHALAHELQHAEDYRLVLAGQDREWLEQRANATAARLCGL